MNEEIIDGEFDEKNNKEEMPDFEKNSHEKKAIFSPNFRPKTRADPENFSIKKFHFIKICFPKI